MSLTFVPPPNQQGLVQPNILLYGPPKTAKTTAACNTGLPTLLLNADLPNASYFARSQDSEGKIMEAEITGLQTMIDTVLAVKADERFFDVVVTDPVGELHRRLLEEQSKRAIRPAINTYGDVSVHIERFCRGLCESPVTAIFVCHDWGVKDESTGSIDRLPWTGTTNTALGMKLMGMVDIVGFTGVVTKDDGTVEYGAQLIHQGGRRGGSRFAQLGAYQPLDIGHWLNLINNAVPA